MKQIEEKGRRVTNSRQMKFSLDCFFLISLLLFTSVSAAPKRSFVVYLGAHSHGPNPSTSDFERASAHHHDFLGSFLREKRSTRDSIFYSYTKSINGFAAIMDEEHAARIAEHPDVVSVFPDEPLKLQTTHSWRFMGLEDEKQLLVPNGSLWTKARFGEGVIIGNIDTGVWPESMSFDDYGLGDIPAGKWRGRCDGDVKCNRKLIGARLYGKGSGKSRGGGVNSSEDYNTARDYNGHGTHTLATAAGCPVAGASIFGYAKGTARGGSPRARVAAYKACFDSGSCFSSDILASFDAAIHDGVDVLSVSLAAPTTNMNTPPYFHDTVAIGAFHAVRNNIVVVAAAGNYGPSPGSVSNPAPWVFTVAASTTDREISSSLVLNDGKIFPGRSLSTATLSLALTYPIVDAVDAKRAEAFAGDAELCSEETLDERKVRGKVVVCRWARGVEVESGAEVRRAGGAGMVVVEAPLQEDNAEAHVLPATVISKKDGNALLRHMRAMKILNRTVRGTITRPVTVFGSGLAPVMAGFSSRGPNKVTPVILKPDITAPGVDILAAYTQEKGPSDLQNDTRRVPFTMMSGTSMSCPHIAGIAGLLRALYPTWSPAAIRSAMMTTATTKNNAGGPIEGLNSSGDNPFGYGAGHVRPNAAMDPGLVYDLSVTDYLDFLCATGYNSSQIKSFSTNGVPCHRSSFDVLNFNYPSITVPKLGTMPVTVSRIVKNVGSPGRYKATVEAPPGVKVLVKPTRLVFSNKGTTKRFHVTLEADQNGSGRYVFGMLTWSDGTHYVRSPIVVNNVVNP